MSNKAISWAIKVQTKNATQKAVLLVLADHADNLGVAFPKQKTIAKEACCSLDAVQAALKILRKLGVVRSEVVFDRKGRRTTNRYWLSIEVETKPQIAVQEAELSRTLPGVVGGQITPHHILNPQKEPSKREAALSRTSLPMKEESEVKSDVQRLRHPSSATVVSLLAKPIDPDWRPTEVGVQFARECGLRDDEIAEQSARFVSHYLQTPRDPLSRNWAEKWKSWIGQYDPAKSRLNSKKSFVLPELPACASSTPENPYPSDDPLFEYFLRPTDAMHWGVWMQSFFDGGRMEWIGEAAERGGLYVQALSPGRGVKFRMANRTDVASTEVNAQAPKAPSEVKPYRAGPAQPAYKPQFQIDAEFSEIGERFLA